MTDASARRVLPRAAEPETSGRLDRLWDDKPGWRGQLTAVQNDAIGTRMVLTGFFFLLLGGTVDSFIMRAQLAVPDNDLIGAQLYSEMFTNHGSVTMFLVILPIFEGFAILTLPTILGAREMPFPRLGAYAYWTFLMGGLLYYSSALFQLVPDAGWFAYTPLSGLEFSADKAIDFWVLGLGTAEVGAIAGAIEITIAVLKLRAPGMSLARLPLYAWSMLIFAVMILFAFTPLIVGSFFLELDRGFGFRFFDTDFGGSSLLWQHLFWIFGHPEVYIQFLPATGIVSMIVPVMCRRRLVGYTWVVAAMIGIGFLSFGLWAHHMFTVGLPQVVLAFFAAASTMIAIPAGVQIFAWLATIWEGRPRWNPPMLFVAGFIVTFVIGGITGVMVAAVPFDAQAHDSYFVVGHLHYVLIGGVALPMFAGVYYWLPKFSGRMLGERLGRWNFWLLFVGLHVTFFPMHIVGLLGMPRRIHTYGADTGWSTYNLISSLGVLVIIAGMACFVVNVVRSYRHGTPAGPNPWNGYSLEWALPSPPPQQGWTTPPIVRSRYPLWDQEDLYHGTPQEEALVHSFARWPLRWRAVIVVGTGNGKPEEIMRVASTSYWPLVTALATVGIFGAELLHLRWGIAAGLAMIGFAVVMWHRPVDPPMTADEELAFEAEHGIPIRADGSEIIPRWAMALGIAFLSIFFSALVLGYFYLRLDSTDWPPADLPELGLGGAAPIAAASVLTASFAQRARRMVASGEAATSWLAAAGVAGVVTFGGAIVELRDLPFGPGDHAYGSIVHTINGFLVMTTTIGIVMSAMVTSGSRRGCYSRRRFAAVDNLARYWLAIATMTVLGLTVTTLTPRLTS